jgi:hypothetical protein
LPDATARLLEGAERDALEDMFEVAPPGVGRAERIGGATVLVAPGLHSFFNRAFAMGLDEPLTPDDVDAILATLRRSSEWSIQPPPGEPELESWLAKRRLERRLAWAKVLRGSEPPPDIRTDLHVRELGAADAPRFGAVVAAAFGLPPVMAEWSASLVGRDRWRAYGAFDGDALVGAGALFCDGDIGWLGMGGTLPFHRGRGAQGAVMARRIADAIAVGCTTIATETGILPGRPNPSLDNMLRCGFEIAYERGVWA